MNTLGEFYDVKKVARILCVHPNTVYLWIYKQQLEAYNINGLIRVSNYDLEEFLYEKRLFVDTTIDDFESECYNPDVTTILDEFDLDDFEKFLKAIKRKDSDDVNNLINLI